MWIKKTFRIEEVANVTGMEVRVLLEWIRNEWIMPAQIEEPQLDDEDIARVRLIQSLRSEFGVNDEAVEIILHLLDQIHHLHYQLKKERD